MIQLCIRYCAELKRYFLFVETKNYRDNCTPQMIREIGAPNNFFLWYALNNSYKSLDVAIFCFVFIIYFLEEFDPINYVINYESIENWLI